MALTKTSKAGGLGIVCRELTVLEIRDWLKGLQAGVAEPDPVGDTLIEASSQADLLQMTNATQAQLDALTPSELRELAQDCKDVNPDFFALRERIEEGGRRLLEQLSNSLSETPAP
ncbi:hypothetical protein D9M68_790220 [compost metagenome]